LLRVQVLEREGTSSVKRSKGLRRVVVRADGVGVVSHVGVRILRELARDTGLSAGVSRALADTYASPWLHAPGRVLTDMAVAIADGADCVSHVEVFGDRHEVCGPVAKRQDQPIQSLYGSRGLPRTFVTDSIHHKTRVPTPVKSNEGANQEKSPAFNRTQPT
jgi:hypothetical protein